MYVKKLLLLLEQITYFVNPKTKVPKYQIITQDCNNHINKIIFQLKKRDGRKILVKTAGEILLDKNLMTNLSLQDACHISYVAGYEHSYEENSSENEDENG